MKKFLFTAILGLFFSYTLPVIAQKPYHTFDFGVLIKRVTVAGQYGLNPEYLKEIAKAEPFLGDFYGVQILKEVSREKIREDFKVTEESDTTLSVAFGNGHMRFFPDNYMDILGNRVDYPFAIFEGETFADFLSVKNNFYEYLRQQQLLEVYLLKNPFYAEELEVEKGFTNPTTPLIAEQNEARPILRFGDLTIYRDAVHGDMEAFNSFLEFLKTTDFDWLGIEMLNTDMQRYADDFIFANESSSEYKTAKQKLEAFYATSWINHFKIKPTTPEENPFIRLFTLMRKKQKRVYAMESSDLIYLFFRNGETPFGGAVRSALWAENVPSKGKGVVYGGSAHFNNKEAVNFQDFYSDRSLR